MYSYIDIPNYVPPRRNVPVLKVFEPITSNEIEAILLKLGSKHCDLDSFPPSLIMRSKNEMSNILVDIVNTSFVEGSFPNNWKNALIKPLIKKMNAGTTVSNYRPVSNLKYFSKVLECAALKQI